MVAKHFPDVHAHFGQKKHRIVPELYCQKYFCGLSVHVLPFESLYVYFDRFSRDGFRYLLAFALNVVSHLKADLLK